MGVNHIFHQLKNGLPSLRTPRVCFTIKLADRPMEVWVQCRQTKEFCRDYLTEEPPDASVSVCREDIRAERNLSVRQAREEGHSPPWYSKRSLELLALCRKVTAELLAHDVLLFHGAVMAVNGKAYLFTAKSGTGKTTHCQLWLKTIPDCHILNGDKPLLLFRDGGVYACGSPWRGKERYGVNETLPLEAIILLERDDTNHIAQTTMEDSFETLVRQTHIPKGNGNFSKAVSLLGQLSSVKLYRLGCNMEEHAAEVAYQAMIFHTKKTI